MAAGQLDYLVRHLRKLMSVPAATDLTDGQLLERFAAGREEAAFEALLQRHGALVLGVCRRVLHDTHEVEDAFQATFLVLAHKAGSIRKLQSVGSWLYGVASRVALRARANALRRRQRERQAEPMPSTDPLAEAAWREVRAVLDEELSRLPEKYRAPVVLCCLEGKTHEQAARELGWPAGSMSRWLARGRQLLRQRLTRRGVGLSTGLLLATLAEKARAVMVPPALLASTLRAATLSTAGLATAALSPHITTLAEGALKTMLPTRIQTGARILLALAILAAGAGLLMTPQAGSKLPAARGGEKPKPAPRANPKAVANAGPVSLKTIKAILLRRQGGNARSEAAVDAGLRWLAAHQAPDGHWDFNHYGRCNCGGLGTHKNPIAATAFGLLPFLGAGFTHQPDRDNPYHKNVLAGLNYLKRQQHHNGDFGGGTLYAHGLAAIALCEAYGLTQDRLLKASAQKAVNYIVYAQHNEGGWRYGPRQKGDTSVTGWQVSALTTARLAGLDVPEKHLKLVEKFLDGVQDAQAGGYGYITPGSGPATSAIGLLCRQKLQGWGPNHPSLIKGVKNLLWANRPDLLRNAYYSHYATQVMHHLGGRAWRRWNEPVRDNLLKRQDDGAIPQRAHQKGSWGPDGDSWGLVGGRLMMTSFALLNLEVYYRSDLLLANRPARELTARELNAVWSDLAGAGGVKLRQEIWQLVRAPRQTVPFLKDRLRPVVTTIDARRIARLIADLNSDQFRVRDQASKELAQLGEAAEAALQRAVQDRPPVEVLKRLQLLLAKLDRLAVSPERMRQERALEILEYIGSAEAVQVLQTLAGGAPGAWLTEAARATRKRLREASPR